MPWLEWLDRKKDLERAPHVPYRLLEPVHDLSVGDPEAGNMLVQGDNLDALKALLPYYAGQVKCIFIDPPYNTKSAVSEHYDDNLEHAQWLSMMYPRLELLRRFLREDGSIWITLDDNEAHYLRVIGDEIFGRKNFIANVVWQKTLTRRNDAKIFSSAHDHVLVFAKNVEQLKIKRQPADERQRATYTNRDNDPRGDWLAIPFHAPNIRENLMYPITTPGGRVLVPPPGRHWSTTQEKFQELLADNRIYFGRDGNGMAQRKKFWSESQATVVPWTWWPYTEAGENREANREAKAIAESIGVEEVFSTPKPERLIKRILDLSTDPGDVIMDSFLGSGTTAAVAHKMGRRWIGIEFGDHAVTHCQPRLQKVVEGEQGGISAEVGWNGGGGFHFYRLGPAVFDDQGRIRPDVRFKHLAAHLWFAETGTPRPNINARSPLLGVHDETAYYLLFNGILGDRRPDSGNVLTTPLLNDLPPLPEGAKRRVIFGEATRIGPERLRSLNIQFKQIPYDIHAR